MLFLPKFYNFNLIVLGAKAKEITWNVKKADAQNIDEHFRISRRSAGK